MLLAVTIVTVWCHELGEEVLETEQCCQFDPGWKRELSVFQLGPHWLAYCIAIFPQRLSAFSASLRPIHLLPCLPKR